MANVITIAQQKGGVGKTTLTAQLAIAACIIHPAYKVAVIDLDPQGSLTRWYALRELDRKQRLNCLNGSAWQADSLIREGKRSADLVIVDCPPRADAKIAVALRSTHLTLLPCQPICCRCLGA